MDGRRSKYNGGFTLIEAMITVGIAGIAILALSQMMVLGLSGSSKTHALVGFQSLVSEIRMVMISPTACSASLLGKVPYKLALGQNPGDPGTSNAASTAATIFQPDGTTPLITSGGSWGSVTKIALQLYDLGPEDTVMPQLNQIHVIGIYVAGTLAAGTSGGPQSVSSVVYTHSTLNGANKIQSCNDGSGNIMFQRTVAPVAATGGVTGTWLIERAGDTAAPLTPRAGTLEFAYGSGYLTTPGSTVQNPLAPLVAGRGDFIFVYTDTTWSAYAYKVW